mmetsp:Transcript_99087/g.171776  ORF Transcript_99087/g.171776 Transcript_99087/m.171776 type:complete len:511 (+) Transcript_99087:65-1597(+)
MPFGALHAVYPAQVQDVFYPWDQDAAVGSSPWAGLLGGTWLKSHKATSFALEPQSKPTCGKIATNFGEAQITTCREGFRCVSRTGRFGTEHEGEVNRENARMAQSKNKAKESKDGESGDNSDSVDEGKGVEVEEYEWNCPVAQQWVPDKFESGVESDQCREEKDCVCIARGAEDGHVELKDGIEKQHVMIQAEIGCGGGKVEKVPMIVIPHYQIRKIPEAFSPDNINSEVGEVTSQPRETWVQTYKNNAPKLQFSLDRWRNWITEKYTEKVDGKPFVCGTPQPGQAATMNDQEVHEASVKLRRFQIFQQDCVDMRDTIPKLISPTSDSVQPPGQMFAPSGHYKTEKLNCYNPKNGDVCLQLNCYTGHDDAIFRDHLREFEAKMMECEPEPEDIGVTKDQAVVNSTAAAAKAQTPAALPQTGTNPPTPEPTAGQKAAADQKAGLPQAKEGEPLPTGVPTPKGGDTLPGNAPAKAQAISGESLTLLLMLQKMYQHANSQSGQNKNDGLRDFL